MTPYTLKREFWLSVLLAAASVAVLGFLLLAVVFGRFPEILFPLVERFFGTEENAAVAADLGIKLGAASVLGLLISLAGFVHYLVSKRKVTNAAMR